MTGSRGPYRKGVERRRLILDAALEAYAESGASGPTLKAIAEKVGLTETAVLHYFASREELLAAVVQARDDAAGRPAGGAPEQYGEMIADNAGTPGLVRLFVEVAAAAAAPEHPAHDHFRLRYRRYVEQVGEHVRAIDPSLDDDRAAWAARMIIAATDGLQLQWLFDPSIDMRSDLRRLYGELHG